MYTRYNTQKAVTGLRLNSRHPLNRSLVGLWPFNEGSGNKLFDLSGNQLPGTIYNATWTQGPNGPCLNFNGSSAYIDTNCYRSFSSGPLTFIIWFRTANSTYQVLFNKASTYQNIIDISTESDNLANSVYDGSDWRGYSDSSRDWTDGTWHMAASVINSTNITLYGDGKYLGTDTHDNSFPTNSNPWIIGRRGFSSYYYFDGDIDHAMLLSRDSSASEIAQLYREPFCMFERMPIELWMAAMGGEAPPAGIPIFRRRRAG